MKTFGKVFVVYRSGAVFHKRAIVRQSGHQSAHLSLGCARVFPQSHPTQHGKVLHFRFIGF